MLRPIDLEGQTTDVMARVMGRRFTVPGFEDVLRQAGFSEANVGEGGLMRGPEAVYNTSPSVSQLTTAIAIARDPAARHILEDGSVQHGSDVIRALRERNVLAGMRVLDLGCGMRPGFALAAKALGADV